MDLTFLVAVSGRLGICSFNTYRVGQTNLDFFQIAIAPKLLDQSGDLNIEKALVITILPLKFLDNGGHVL